MIYKELKVIIEKTFNRRKTHGVPSELLPPPKSWEGAFKSFELGVTMDELFEKVNIFWKRVI